MSLIATPGLAFATGTRLPMRNMLHEGRSVLRGHGAERIRHAAASLAVAVGLLLTGSVARADEGWENGQRTIDGAHTDRVRVQPTAREFAPPYQPDVGASAARDIDALYQQLTGAKPDRASDARSRASTSSLLKVKPAGHR